MFQIETAKENERFYHSRAWKRLRLEVLQEQHYECQMCKERHRLTLLNRDKASVHHVNEIKDRPDLKLSKFYIDEQGNKKRNLIAVCNDCHNEIHKRFQARQSKKQFNEEKW